MDVSKRPVAKDAWEVGWRFLVALGVGATAGALIGGIGGRLVMFVLRLASDNSLHGVLTDDSFEIGQFSTATGFLLMVTAGLGGAAGVVYLLLRSALPRRGRAVVFGVFAAIFGGADLLKPEGIDFTLLHPKPFAVASFILLPGLGAFVIAVFVERLLAVEPWSRRALTVALGLAALPLFSVLPAVAAMAAVVVAVRRRSRLADAVLTFGKVAVPVGLVSLTGWSGLELWRDATEIL